MYKIGIIGFGKFGHFVAEAIEELPNFEVAGYFDISDVEGIYRKFELADQLLSDEAIEIIYIATPNFLHADLAIRALEKGKKVLLEKPPFIKSGDGEEVVRAIKENGGSLKTNIILDQLKNYKQLKKIVSENKYGKLRIVNVRNLATEALREEQWFHDEKQSGGWLLESTIHLLHLMSFLNDHPIENIELKKIANGSEDANLLILDQGTQVIIYHDLTAIGRQEFTAEFIFDNATILVENWIADLMEIKTPSAETIIAKKDPRESLYKDAIKRNFLELVDKDSQELLEEFQSLTKITEILIKVRDEQMGKK